MHQALLRRIQAQDDVFAIAADDLGAGNAGLRLLAQVRFDVLKVDLSLVQRSGPGAPSNAVIGSVVGLAMQTDALVIAEGLEHEEQVTQVATLGVRAGQGYLLGRPGPLPVFPPRRATGELPGWKALALGLSGFRFKTPSAESRSCGPCPSRRRRSSRTS